MRWPFQLAAWLTAAVLAIAGASTAHAVNGPYPVETAKPKKPRPRPRPTPTPTPTPLPTPDPADAMLADVPEVIPVEEAPLPEPTPPPITRARPREGVLYDAQVWGQVAISSATEPGTAVKPGGRISVDGPIAFGESGIPKLRLLARLDISALPGQTFNLGDVATFGQDAEWAIGTAWRIGRLRLGDQEITTALLAEYGGATMLDGEVRDRYLYWVGGGVRFAESSGGDLTLMYGRHEGGGDAGWGQAMLAFSFPMGFADQAVILGGSFILSVGPQSGARQRDVLRLWTAVSLPNLVKAIRKD